MSEKAAAEAPKGPPKGPPKFAPLKGVKIRKATEAEQEAYAPPQEKAGDIASLVVAPLFPAARVPAPPKKKAVVVEEAEAAPAPKPKSVAVATKAARKERTSAVERAEKEEEEADAAAEKVEADVDLSTLPEPLQALGKPIVEEDYGNPYVQKTAPAAYVPTTRRGFSEFIESAFRTFALPPPHGSARFREMRETKCIRSGDCRDLFISAIYS